MSITLLMFAETLTPRGLFPPGFYINFSYSVSLYSIKAPTVQNCGCFWDKFSGVGFQLPGRQAEGLHGLAVHGVDRAVARHHHIIAVGADGIRQGDIAVCRRHLCCHQRGVKAAGGKVGGSVLPGDIAGQCGQQSVRLVGVQRQHSVHL